MSIGSGNGHFIAHYGEKNTKAFLIGIETKRKRCVKIIKKIEKRKLRNIEIIQGRAEDFLEMLPPSRVDVYHIYFPDPWPKAKHRKRRILRKLYLDLLAKSMRNGGTLNFATDYFDYALQVKVLLCLHDSFNLIENTPPEEIFLSVYADKFKKCNRPVRFISAVKI